METATEIDVARELIKNMAQYFWIEMNWEGFRGEFLSSKDEQETVHFANAQKLATFMQEVTQKYPQFKELLKP